MIEWILSGLVSLLAWLWNSAMTLYYLAGFFVVLGGFVVFIGSIAHHFWKRSHEQRPTRPTRPSAQPRVTVHVENLNVTLELTGSQLRGLLSEGTLPALPPANHPDECGGV
jgi:fatty acid desaturase